MASEPVKKKEQQAAISAQDATSTHPLQRLTAEALLTGSNLPLRFKQLNVTDADKDGTKLPSGEPSNSASETHQPDRDSNGANDEDPSASNGEDDDDESDSDAWSIPEGVTIVEDSDEEYEDVESDDEGASTEPIYPYDPPADYQEWMDKLSNKARLYAFISYNAWRFFRDRKYQRSWNAAMYLYLLWDIPRYTRIHIIHLMAHLMPSNMGAFLREADQVCDECIAVDPGDDCKEHVDSFRETTRKLRDMQEQCADGSRDVVPSLTRKTKKERKLEAASLTSAGDLSTSGAGEQLPHVPT